MKKATPKLKEIDLKHLYFRYDEENEKIIPYKGKKFLRLVDNGIITEDFTLTEKGKQLREKCVAKFKEMEFGIPFHKRPKLQIVTLRAISNFWLSIPIRSQIVLLDPSRSFMIASTVQELRQRRLGPYKKKWLTKSIDRMSADFKENGIKAEPMVFQRTSDWLDFIWLKAGETWVCIQAKFYEVMANMYREEGVEFYTTEAGYAVFVSVGGLKGFNGMSAVIMTMDGIECEAIKTGRIGYAEKTV